MIQNLRIAVTFLLIAGALVACTPPAPTEPPSPPASTPVKGCFVLETAEVVKETLFAIDGGEGAISLRRSTVKKPICQRHFWAQAVFTRVEPGKRTAFVVVLMSGDRQVRQEAKVLNEVSVGAVLPTGPYVAGSIEPAPEMKACIAAGDLKSQCTEAFKYSP